MYFASVLYTSCKVLSPSIGSPPCLGNSINYETRLCTDFVPLSCDIEWWFRSSMLLPSSVSVLNVEEMSSSDKTVPTSKTAHCCSLKDDSLNIHQCENLQFFSHLSNVSSSQRIFSKAIYSHVSLVCIFPAIKNRIVNGCPNFLWTMSHGHCGFKGHHKWYT